MYSPLNNEQLRATWLRNPRTAGIPVPPIISMSDMSKGLISSETLYDALGFGDEDDDDQPDCAILYYPEFEIPRGHPMAGAQVGHYTAIVFPPDSETVHYFDPYGSPPDEVESMSRELSQTAGAGVLKELYDGDQTELLKQILSYDGDLSLDWSEKSYQSQADPRIATCGLWALDRCFHADLTNKQFKDVWKYRKGMPEFETASLDEIVVSRWA